MPYFEEHKTAIVYTNLFAGYFRTKFEPTVDRVQKNIRWKWQLSSARYDLIYSVCKRLREGLPPSDRKNQQRWWTWRKGGGRRSRAYIDLLRIIIIRAERIYLWSFFFLRKNSPSKCTCNTSLVVTTYIRITYVYHYLVISRDVDRTPTSIAGWQSLSSTIDIHTGITYVYYKTGIRVIHY